MSLRTSDRSEARRQAASLWQKTEQLFTMARTRSLTEDYVALFLRRLSEEPIYGGTAAHEALALEDQGLDLFAGLTADDLRRLSADLPDDRFEHLRAAMARYLDLRRTRWAEIEADRAEEAADALWGRLQEADARIAELEADRAATPPGQAMVAQAVQAPLPVPIVVPGPVLVREFPLEANEIFLDADAAPASSAKASRPRGKGKVPKLSEAEAAFIDDKRTVAKWSEQTIKQAEAGIRLAIDLIGDRPLSDYTGADAAEFRKLLLKLPASHGEGGRVNAHAAIVAADRKAEDTGRPVPRMKLKTVKRHFSAMSQMWEWAGRSEYADRNDFRGFDFPGTKSDNKKVSDWSERDLLTLLRSEHVVTVRNQDAPERWFPIIAMFSGMRLEEIARLRPEDFATVDDVLMGSVFNVMRVQNQPDGDEDEEEDGDEDGWTPKTQAGVREVPLHSMLIELGLLDLVERRRQEGAERVFPGLLPKGPDGKLSATFSKNFGNRKRALGIGRKTKFHSFRHSVSTILRNATATIRGEWIDAVLGHHTQGKEKSVGVGTYTKRYGASNLHTTVNTITYSPEVLAVVRATVLPMKEVQEP